ncbi:M20/M25/M40 family metallo-hydrolase [Aequorivita echinoideorum]|uniref:Carboxypeptidase Q n=1 Tax=Aequorivita echinoideorum TaxID=1549647 RepID=A0ABS5S4U0_9FLAO|nr:M20/M25/M40 family metallo-hydrolase [Aequorivita echinoideorum]MBT0608242.1 M20/M25/M40 family metallo-hydrolase [Aequorivita echinoideorum]
MKNYSFIISLCFLLVSSTLISQNTSEDSLMLRKIFTKALTEGKSYDWLDYLSNQIGSRLSGSLEAENAVKYTEEELKQLGVDKVWLQPVMVPKWTRGFKEYAYIETLSGETTVTDICALGGSVPTPNLGIKAEVVEVKGLEDLAMLGKDKIEGKIVFFNRPMDASLISTFEAYGGAVDQRSRGAAEASKYGAVGVLVRSMNLRLDDFPHAGAMNYGDTPTNQRIPAASISTNGAEYLSNLLSLQPNLKFYYKLNCKTFDDVQSYNVIGEITGSEQPDKYIVVGGHLDSWDLGDGSHDDGAGCVQSMEVLRILKEIGYKPKHTLRVVLFMNEENGLRGGLKYAEEAKRKNEKHLLALESDAGGFTPRGFSFESNAATLAQVRSWAPLFKPYNIHLFEKGHGGADIGPLAENAEVLAGLRPDSQRYFDYHHAANDTFDAVNKRELELGAASMASLVYLFDKYGTK